MGDAPVCPETGKQQMTHTLAVERARAQRRRYSSRSSEYMCEHCGWWHIGSLTTKRRRGRRRAR